MNPRARLLLGLLLASAMMAAGGALSANPAFQRLVFCAPAAHLAGLVSGAPCLRDGDDYRLPGSDLDLVVVPACAATDYFCLMAGFLSLLLIWRRCRLVFQLLVLPAAWVLTIIINALRLAACWQTDRLAQVLLPSSLWSATHMAVGVVTFLTGLTLVFYVYQRRTP